MNKIQIIRGFNDILPTDSHKWQYLESKIKSILQNYNYDETRFKNGEGGFLEIIGKGLYERSSKTNPLDTDEYKYIKKEYYT